MMNPLLETAAFPSFAEIRPEHVKPAIEQRIQECRQSIAQIIKQPDLTWEKSIQPLEIRNSRLQEAWSPVSHLNSVSNSAKLREVYESCLPLLSEYSTFVGQNEALHRVFVNFQKSDAFNDLTQAQKHLLKIHCAILHCRVLRYQQKKKNGLQKYPNAFQSCVIFLIIMS